MNLNSAEDEGWEVYGKKGKAKAGTSSSKQVRQNSNTSAWGLSDNMQRLGMRSQGGSGRGSGQTWQTSDVRKPTGRGYTKPQTSNKLPDSTYVAPIQRIPPPRKDGWVWGNRGVSSQSSQENMGQKAPEVYPANDQASTVVSDDDEEDSDNLDDSDDELSDGFNSDESQKSHETRKKNRWFGDLFQCLDGLSIEQINEPERQWHCPACKGGPGAIDWYHLQPLIAHARTKRSKRVKLHRELAKLLDEELRRRGTSAVPAGEMFGQWKGLEERNDKEIVWPPMVIIMNTRLEKGDNDKWIGMGNQELLEYFQDYSAVKARHSYGPQGHRGMSLLIFEPSAVGYVEAERLSKHFEDTGRDRLAWDRNRVPFYAGGKRQLYGYMAEKRDLEYFNQHCQGKSKLKYEMRSYQEMVVKQMKQMSEENQQLIWYKNRVAKDQKTKKALEETISVMADKFRRTVEESNVVKLRTKKHHEKIQEEMDSQERFFNEQLQEFYDTRNAKEEKFEMIQQNEREKLTMQAEANVSIKERLQRAEEAEKLIKLQDRDLKAYTAKRDALMEAHKQQLMDLKRRHREEEMSLEKDFDAKFDKLLEEYSPGASKQGGDDN